MRDLGDALQGRERPHRAEAAVGGVLDRDQPRARRIAAVGIAQRGLDLVGGEHAVGAVEHADHDARIGGRAAGLGVDDVGGPVGDHLVAQPAMDADGGLVAHGAARHEDGVFLAEDLADPVAQPVDGGVLVLLLVAHFGLGHGFPHAGRRLGLGVAVEIDEPILHGVLCSPAPPYRRVAHRATRRPERSRGASFRVLRKEVPPLRYAPVGTTREGCDEVHLVPPDAVAAPAGRFPGEAPLGLGRHAQHAVRAGTGPQRLPPISTCSNTPRRWASTASA